MQKFSFRSAALLVTLSLATIGCQADSPALAETQLVRSQQHLTDAEYAALTPVQQVALGKQLFFDKSLSATKTQSCSSCHAPGMGFGGPDAQAVLNGKDITFIEGAIRGAFGGRKSPSAAYASLSPQMFWTAGDENIWRGGAFWDGRASGFGHPSATPINEQALGPFLSSAEHAFGSLACVVYRAQNTAGNYYATFFNGISISWAGFNADWCAEPTSEATQTNKGDAIRAWIGSLEIPAQVALTASWNNIANAIAQYESSPEVNSYSSKWDAGRALTVDERAGEQLFVGKGQCAACHVGEPLPNAGGQAGGAIQLVRGVENFSDFSYYNIGLPANPNNPAIIPPARDFGLGSFLERALANPALVGGTYPADALAQPAQFMGAFKTVTVRNVGKGHKTYMHNGVLKTVAQVVHFYNTRDRKQCVDAAAAAAAFTTINARGIPACWPAPEVGLQAGDVNNIIGWGVGGVVRPGGNAGRNPNLLAVVDLIGNLGMTPREEAQLVAFLMSLSDQRVVQAP